MPGVEIHAQVLESALTGALISQPIYGIVIEFTTALLFGLLVIVFAPLFGPVTLVALGAAFAAALIGTSVYFYAQHRQLIDFTYPLMSTTAIYLTLIFSSFVREQAQRRQIRSAFGQYLSPALVEQLAQSPEKLVLGGEEREMTIMPADLSCGTASGAGVSIRSTWPASSALVRVSASGMGIRINLSVFGIRFLFQ